MDAVGRVLAACRWVFGHHQAINSSWHVGYTVRGGESVFFAPFSGGLAVNKAPMTDDPRATPKSHVTDRTSLSLLDRVRTQDATAWQRLVDLYSPLIFCWCQRAGLDSEDAGDVMQEVFAKVAAKIDGFRHDRQDDTFRGWLRVVTRNQIRLHYRKVENQAQAVGGTTAHLRIQEVAEDSASPFETTEEEECSGIYHRALELIRTEFEEKTWKAFLATAVEGRSSTEVAEDLEMTPGAVRQAKYKVLRKIRAELCHEPDLDLSENP